MGWVVERALEHLTRGGALRTTQLAAELGCSPETLTESLEPLCQDGTLVSCGIYAGGIAQREYRLAARPQITPMRLPEKRTQPVLLARKEVACGVDAIRDDGNVMLDLNLKITGQEPKGEEPMAAKDKLLKQLERAGTQGAFLVDMAKAAGLEYQTAYCAIAVMLKNGDVHLSGKDGVKNRYALGPGADASAAERSAERAGPRRREKTTKKSVHKTTAKARKKAGKVHSQGANVHPAAADSHKGGKAPVSPAGFRCAIYSDGALHIQKGGAHADEIELAEPEVRALFRYLEKVFQQEARA